MNPRLSIIAAAVRRVVQGGGGGAPSDPYINNVVFLSHFNGTHLSTTIADDCGSTVTSVNNSRLIDARKKFGVTSLDCGPGQHLVVPHRTELNLLASDLTIEMWIYPQGAWYQVKSLLTKYVNQNVGFSFQVSSTGQLAFVVGAGNYYSARSTSAIPVDQWVHVAVTLKNKTARLFVNGVMDGSADFSGYTLTDSSSTMYIGFDPLDSARYFYGNIDEMRITRGVARYTSNFTVPTDEFPSPPTDAYYDSYWGYVTSALNMEFDGVGETSTSVVDLKSNAVTVSGATVLSKANKKYGVSSAYLGGSGGMTVSNGAVMNFGTGDFTIEAWVYQPSQTDRGPLFYVTGPGYFGLDCGSYSVPPKLYLPSGNVLVGSINLPSTPVWVHMAVVRSGATLTIYVNGQVSGQTSLAWASGTMGSATGSSLTVGKSAYDLSIFTGYIDDFRVTKGVARYTAAFTPGTSSFAVGRVDPLYSQVTSLLRFNGDSGASVVTDEAGMTWTAVSGTITTETDIKKYGLSAGKFTNTVRYTSSPTINLGSTQDFCIECWIYLEQGTAYQGIFDINATTYAYITTIDTLMFTCPGGDYITPALSLNRWYHIAMVRSAGTVRFIVDGVVGSSVSSSASYANATLTLGYNVSVTGSNRALRGRMDNFRLTIGSPRYTTTPFTPTDCGYLS